MLNITYLMRLLIELLSLETGSLCLVDLFFVNTADIKKMK